MTESPSSNGLTIPVQISVIYETVQKLHTDMAVLKSNGLEGVVEEQGKQIDKLNSQVFGQWIIMGIMLAVITAGIVKGFTG